MKVNSEVRYASHPNDAKHYDTAQLRQNYLMESIDGIQTILTCTGLEEMIEKKKEIYQIYEVKNGVIA